MKRFENKVVMITGAGSGIGKGTALAFAREGAKVVLCGRTAAKIESVAKEIGPSALPVRMDVASLADWQSAIETVHAAFGDVNILINNAGIADQTPFEYLTEEAFRASMETNLMSVFYSYKTVVEDMKKNRWGRIVNISSIAGLRASGDNAAYVASKHAVTGITKTAGYAFAKYNILTNSVHPGVVDTPMMDQLKTAYPEAVTQIINAIPLGRMSTPEDMTGLILFLSSEDNTFINGTGITIDGGQFA